MLRFGFVVDSEECLKKIFDWQKSKWMGFELPSEITFDMHIELYVLNGKEKPFFNIEPSFSKKRNIWSWSVILQENKIESTQNDKELSEYILEETKKRIRELKTYKTLRCIKDRSVLDILDNSLDELFKEWI